MFSRVKCQLSNVNCRQKGFSLIELVVVLAVFIVIITATINIFITVVKEQKRVLEGQELLSQTSYAEEYMAKALGAAVKDTDGTCVCPPGDVCASGNVYALTHCPNGTLEPCQGITFINSLDNNACQEFFLDYSANPTHPRLQERKNHGTPQDILSEKFIIKSGKFVLDGNKTLHVASADDLNQPKVTMLLDILTASNQSEKVIQNTVSQTSSNR